MSTDKTDLVPVSSMSALTPMEGAATIRGLKSLLDNVVEIKRNQAAANVQRAAIRAKSEIEIARVEAETRRYVEDIRRGMEQDRYSHTQKMEIIQIIGDTVRVNAQNLTPEVLTLVQTLLAAI